MGVGSRSYYAWQKRSQQTKSRKCSNLEDKIQAIYFDKKQRYGSPRITAELLDWMELKFLEIQSLSI